MPRSKIILFLLYANILRRRSATIMETPPIIQAYGFSLETLLMKNLHTTKLEMKIEN
jgi:hypothetical protein